MPHPICYQPTSTAPAQQTSAATIKHGVQESGACSPHQTWRPSGWGVNRWSHPMLLSHFSLAPPHVPPTNQGSTCAANVSSPHQTWRPSGRGLSGSLHLMLPSHFSLAPPHLPPINKNSSCSANLSHPHKRWHPVGGAGTDHYSQCNPVTSALPRPICRQSTRTAPARQISATLKKMVPRGWGLSRRLHPTPPSHFSLAPPHLPPTNQGSACAASFSRPPLR